ncbi:MAG: UPF0175 family protein [Candidatus Diapherotrites archaeon]
MDQLDQTMSNLNEVDRFILLLLRANKYAPVPGALWLQKELFLLKELFPSLENETDFAPYFMGPHSEIVQQEADELVESNLIQQKNGKIILTNLGKEVADKLSRKAEKYELEKIEEFKDFLNDLSKDELLAFIYFSFMSEEDLKRESVEFPTISKNRKKLAVSLYQKEKVSLEKAAQIAGIPIDEFVDEVKLVA